ncbi:hypothetical protein OROMI_007959 [Orobanche minor]
MVEAYASFHLEAYASFHLEAYASFHLEAYASFHLEAYASFHLEASTYATTYRDSKYVREREFLKAVFFFDLLVIGFRLSGTPSVPLEVHKCVAGGGKVLIPTFALGRAQRTLYATR